MKSRTNNASAPDRKAHKSDDEGDSLTHQDEDIKTLQAKKQIDRISREEQERRQLENAQVIADSEISPAAYLFQNQEEQDDLALFEQQSQKVKCPFCDAVSFSIVEYRTSLLGYLVAVLSILVFGFFSIILMPFLVSLTKQAIHRCAKCLNEVKNNSYFGFSSLEDKLLTFQVGSLGVILTRRYLLYIVLVITCGLGIYLFVLNDIKHNHEVRPISNITWEQYRRDCGYNALLADNQKAMSRFDRFYYNTAVSWEGYIIRITLNEEDSMNFAYHSSSMMIKMEPSDQEGGHGPDLGISLSERVLTQYKDVIDDMHRGDRIRFNGTILSMGDTQHLHHLHAFALEKLPGHKDVDAHVHAAGRYKFKVINHDESGEQQQTMEEGSSE